MKAELFFTKAGRKLLQMMFGFDKWHISPVQERPYALDVIAFSNRQPRRKFFVEIGCGLGDITRAVDYSSKTGFDIDPKVLKAAAWLPAKNKRATSFKVFQFPGSPLPENIDTLVMVNWIHHIEPPILKHHLAAYLQQHILPGGAIIIDTVQDPAYEFNHHIGYLTDNLQCSITKVGSYPRQREIWAIKKEL